MTWQTDVVSSIYFVTARFCLAASSDTVRFVSLQVIGETEACAQKFKGKHKYKPIHLKSILNCMQKVSLQAISSWHQVPWPHAACLAHVLLARRGLGRC